MSVMKKSNIYTYVNDNNRSSQNKIHKKIEL
jgi:hypothetical protein